MAKDREIEKRDRRIYLKEYYYKNRKRLLGNSRRYHLKIRMTIIEHYGGKCACCSEDRIEFLVLDHINGGGGKERRLLGSRQVYLYVIKNKFPDRYRILCHNCNAALKFYGYCPHKKEI